MITATVLLMASWLPFHHHQKNTQAVESARYWNYLDVIFGQTIRAIDEYPTVNREYFVAILTDLRALENEDISSAATRLDLDALDRDIEALKLAVEADKEESHI